MTARIFMPVTVTALLFTLFTGNALASSTVPDWNISGIPDAGFPHFEDSVKVTFARSGSNWKLTANERSGTHRFQLSPTEAYKVTNVDFSLEALFDTNLRFKGGELEIEGKINGLGVNTKTTLWEASLTDFGVDYNPFDGSPIALGFETDNHGGWATLFDSGMPESVYLFTPSLWTLALNVAGGNGTSVNINATALTTVPVPAAVWLLGSGLMALLGGRRRNTVSAAPA